MEAALRNAKAQAQALLANAIGAGGATAGDPLSPPPLSPLPFVFFITFLVKLTDHFIAHLVNRSGAAGGTGAGAAEGASGELR